MNPYLDFIKLQSLETELLEIKTSSEKIGTYLKGLTGQNTNLDEHDWLLVRTNEFKDKYGDWERYFKCKFLLKHPEVCFLSGNEFSPINGKTLTDQVEEYFIALGGKVISPFFGKVTLDRKGADDSLAHGMGRLKAIAYAAVKDVIENGILIHYDFNHKNRGYNSAVLAAPIMIGEERFVCEVAVTLTKDNCKFYLHEVTKQKKLLDAVFITNLAHKPSAHLGVFAKILQNIISAKDLSINCTLDENGEPILATLP